MYRGFYSPPRYGLSSQSQQKFPEDIELVIKSEQFDKGNLFISNIEAAENFRTIQKHNIKAILSCAKGYQVSHPKSLVPEYKYIPAEDRSTYDITPYIEECVDFIHENIQRHNILVHCIAGVSRSVSMVLAYLIRERDMGYDQAYRTVKSRRNIIHPNDGFISQLRDYEKKIKATGKPQKKKKDQQIILERSKTLPPRKDQFATPMSKSINYENYFNTKDQSKTRNYKNNTVYKQSRLYPGTKQQLQRRYDDLRSSQTKRQVQNLKNPEQKSELKYKYLGQFGQLNQQLDAKIQAIRQKYEKQRQQLVSNRKKINSYYDLGSANQQKWQKQIKTSPKKEAYLKRSYDKFQKTSSLYSNIPRSKEVAQRLFPSRDMYQNKKYSTNSYELGQSRFSRPYNASYYF